MLENLEKLKKDAGAVHAALYEADGSVLERLKMMAADPGRAGGARPEPQAIASQRPRCDDRSWKKSAFDLSRYLDKLDLDPGELAEVNDRLNTINRILNKYGDTDRSTLAYREEIGAEDRRAGTRDR